MSMLEEAEQFFNKVAAKQEGKEQFSKMNQTAQFILRDKSGEAFYLEVKDGKFNLKKGKISSPGITAESTTEILEKVFRGEISPTEAYDKAEVAPLYFSAPAEKDYRLQWLIGLIRIGQGKYWWKKGGS